MNLWIRSQDRKHLIKCEAIMYEKTGTGYGLIGFTKNYDFNIATYETKERALEVLDEIQAILSPKLKTMLTKDGLNVEVIDKNYDVYQMPEKEEKKEEQEG